MIKRLVGGLMSQSAKTSLAAHKELYEAGSAAIPLIERELHRSNWRKIRHREEISAVVGLAALLHDLDENASNASIAKILRNGCHPAVASALRSIQRFSHSNYRKSMFGDVVIFEEAAIDADFAATTHVQRWLSQLPKDDLRGVSRIYIIKTKESFDYSGQYLQILGVVTLVWTSFLGPRNPIYPLLRRYDKHTLYHEIGHHTLRHNEFGQVPEQEQEANAYARSALARSRPFWVRIIRWFATTDRAKRAQ